MSNEGDVIEQPSSGSRPTYPMELSAIRKNGHAVIKNRPCKITDVSNTGEKSDAKVHLVGLDLFTGEKYEYTGPSTQLIDVPHVFRTDYQLFLIDDGFIQVMSDAGDMREDVPMPRGELGEKIKNLFEFSKKKITISVIDSMKISAAYEAKEN